MKEDWSFTTKSLRNTELEQYKGNALSSSSIKLDQKQGRVMTIYNSGNNIQKGLLFQKFFLYILGHLVSYTVISPTIGLIRHDPCFKGAKGQTERVFQEKEA